MALISRSAAICGLALLALASPVAAGPPGSWTKVTNFDSVGRNTDEVSLVRTGNGVLHVLWTQDTNDAVLNTRISADVQNVLGTSTVFTYDGSVGDVVLLPQGGGLRAFFTGLISSDPNHDGGMSTATSADGVSWAVQPSLASETDDAGNEQSSIYAAHGVGGTTFSDGTPLSIWGDGSAGYHVGTSPTTPDVRYENALATAYAPEAATDSATGAVAIGWSDLDAESTRVAFVQMTTSPWFPPGPSTGAPGGQAPDGSYPVGMTGRSGGAGGIYVSYLRGTNEFDGRPAVWRIGASNAATLSNKPSARYPGIAMGPGGRLWAFWSDADDGYSIHVRRSSTDAATWGAETVVNPPAGASTVWSLKGEGSAAACGALDVVAHASVGSALANYHQRVLAGITLKKKVLNGKKGEKAKVRFKTLDAGEPLDAKIKFGGKKKATGDDGKVKIAVDRKARTRKVTAKATADCFDAAQLKVKVTKDRT